MKKIELIICDEDGTWECEKFVEIPDNILSTEEALKWLIDNNKLEDIEAVHIGVYNWDANYD